MDKLIVVVIVLIILLVYVYYIQFRLIPCEKEFLDDVLLRAKTGDLILFKAFNNFNAIFINSYFGHCGVVYKDPVTGELLMFEGNGIDGMILYPHHPRTGLFLTPLKERLQKYKGKVYFKQLSHKLDDNIIIGYTEFLQYTMSNFKYDMDVIGNGFKKYLGLKRCDFDTDCGQLAFLSLVKFGLIPVEEYDIPMLHHLKYVCKIKHLTDGRFYHELIDIIDHPFAN
jgi:hypothetical protein